MVLLLHVLVVRVGVAVVAFAAAITLCAFDVCWSILVPPTGGNTDYMAHDLSSPSGSSITGLSFLIHPLLGFIGTW